MLQADQLRYLSPQQEHSNALSDTDKGPAWFRASYHSELTRFALLKKAQPD